MIRRVICTLLFPAGQFVRTRHPPPVPDPVAAAGSVHDHNKGLLSAFLRAAGEELGWRCWLLPALLASGHDRVTANVVTGFAWAFFHVAIMTLLVIRTRNPAPVRTVVLQSVSCVAAAWMYGVVSEVAGFTLWAPALMHCTWNLVNPVVLGSVYTNTEGALLHGPPVLVNGEGLAGCLVCGALLLVTLAACGL